MAGKDDDKTVIGGALPPVSTPPSSPSSGPAPGPSDSPFANAPGGQPAPIGQPPVSGAGDKTVIGGALPPQGQHPFPQQGGRVAPTGGPPSAPSTGDTWLGGALPPSNPAPVGGQSPIGSPIGSQQEGFFPETSTNQPVQQQVPTQQIPLHQALKGTGLGKGGSSNPLVAAAANLLILFGRLRTGMVQLDAAPLMDHVTREMDAFERNAIAAGVDPHTARVGTYCLCGTADDIVQNLPGADKSVWLQYSMVARVFNMRDSGVGFFQEVEKAMQSPGQNYNLLELMLTCLSLGFEGRFRTEANGAVQLARWRSSIYETMRRVEARPDEDISINWLPVLLGGRRRFGGIPVWAIAGIAAAIVVGFYATLSTLVNRDGAAVANTLYSMHPTNFKVALERSAGPAFVAKSSQLERIQATLAPEIADGSVAVGTKGDFIYVRVGNLLLFESGAATVKPEFATLAGRIAETLNGEQGPVKILGYTDAIQPSGRGQYKTNLDLSVARAEGVATVIRDQLFDKERVTVEGKGAADPIGDNATREGRAENRRVEILVAREGTF
ncbi:type IVB secretion system protein IcmH/DotU [uncultured Litoreibacter sp.]|uniref:type IVB secretion system protein IcmH/DotU n=1 Tax=uncultured Litoreibacter sp. TaxID=1392394 RepID=UPI002630D8BB|nr:type IVB secretion system protein IcmH/DotU [uncultured Litoreibacter sp.]